MDSEANGRGRARTAVYIRGLIPSLVPSEARVAEALLARLDDPSDWSASDLAAAARTSRATVIRACQSLGFTGLNELRLVLQREQEVAAAVSSGEQANDPLAALDRTIAAGMEQLESMAVMLDRQAFNDAVEALASARRVLVVTLSDLSFLGQYAVFHFALIGRSAEAPTDVIAMHAVASLLEPGDVCLAIGHSGTNALTIRVVEAARAAGAKVIAVTSFARGALAELADIHLAVGVAEPDPGVQTRIRVAQVLVIDALQTALATRLDVDKPSEAMLRTIAQYTYRRPRRQ